MPNTRLIRGWAAVAVGTATVLGAVYAHGVRVHQAPGHIGTLPTAGQSGARASGTATPVATPSRSTVPGAATSGTAESPATGTAAIETAAGVRASGASPSRTAASGAATAGTAASGTAAPGAAASGAVAGAGPAGPPVRLSLPALRAQALVRPVVLDGRDRLGVPDDPRDLGWWRDGQPPGAPAGSVVIDGHADAAAGGPGAFLGLSRLRPGSPVVLRTARGHPFRYTVTARRTLPRDALPPEAFDRTGPPHLVLITCDGPRDHRTRRCTHDVAVIAVPA